MDIKKADPTERLQEVAQESQQTTQPIHVPKGISEVPNSLEQVKQSRFEQAIADSKQEDLLASVEDALDNIPSFATDPAAQQAVLAALFNILHQASDSTPTTTVRSDRFEKLKNVKIHVNEILERARSNNPLEGQVPERIFDSGPDVPLSPVQPGDALAGLQIGQDDESLLDALQPALDSIPSFGVDQSTRQEVLDAFLDLLHQTSDSDQANATDSTATTSVREEQINRIRATLTRILIGGDEK